jgi:hypothetical protein
MLSVVTTDQPHDELGLDLNGHARQRQVTTTAGGGGGDPSSKKAALTADILNPG